MMFDQSFIFDGYDTSPLFYLTRIGEPLLAPVETRDTDFAWDGAVTKSYRLAPIDIETDILLVSHEEDRVQAELEVGRLKRQVAALLYRPYDCPLILPNNPDFYYMAHLTGSSALERLSYTRSTTLTWRVNDPAAFGKSHEVESDGGTVQFLVEGTYRAKPIIEVTSDEPFSIFFDDVPFTVIGTPAHKAIIDREDGSVMSGDYFLKYDILSDIPYFEPGIHTVACAKPFVVRWVERWL